LGLALLLAILMESRYLIAKPFFRTVFFLPVVMSLASTTLAFWMLLHPDIGLVNLLLERVGLPTRDWLRIPELGIPVITAISLWRWTGLNTMIILAGMKGIPRALYEAAEIDGADGWARFWSITLPSLRPVLFFILVMAVIATLQAFDEPWLIAGHGYHPDYISTPVVYLYQQFGYHHLGISAAAGYVLAMGIFVATMLQIRFLGRVSGMTAEA
jgi:lactose/L-arabinose transport system permease protein